MTETFTDICKTLLSGSNPSQMEIVDSYDSPELNYLLLWHRLEKISKNESQYSGCERKCKDDTYFVSGRWIEDLREILDTRDYTRIINTLDLAIHPSRHTSISHTNRPKLFDGYINIKGAEIRLKARDSLINLRVVDSKYRYCLEKPKVLFKLNINQLNGFGSIKVSGLTAYYRRNFDVLTLQTIKSTDILIFIHFLGMTPETLINTRIDAFLNGAIPSCNVLSALIYFSKTQDTLDIDILRLVPRLETNITTCTADLWSYALYRYIGFLIRLRKVKPGSLSCSSSPRQLYRMRIGTARFRESIFDPQFNSVITQDSDMPSILFNRLSSKILAHISEIKREKDSTAKAYHAFRFYLKVGIPLNNIFVHKFFLINSTDRPLLNNLLEMVLLRSCSTESNDLKILNKVCKLFPNDLSRVLKSNSDVHELYQLLFELVGLLKIPKDILCILFEDIARIHKKRIQNATDVVDLREIHGSMITCEKSLGLRNEKIEAMLKKRAGELVKKKS